MDELLRLLDDVRAEERGRSLDRDRLLRRAAAENASLRGTLVDLAEGGTPVSVSTEHGRVVHGTIHLVGTDFLVVETRAGSVWVALGGVAAIQLRPGDGAVASGHRAAADLLLAEALGRVADDRPDLALVVSDGSTVSGQLLAVGVDVVTVRLAGGQLAYVPLTSVRLVLRSG